MKKSIKIAIILVVAIIVGFVAYSFGLQLNISRMPFSRIETLRARRAEQKELLRQPERIDTLCLFDVMRGNILDCNGNVLATSTTVYDISYDPTVWQNDEEWDSSVRQMSKGLAEIIGKKSAAEYYRYFSEGRKAGKKFLRIEEDVDSLTLISLKELPFFNMKPAVGGIILEKHQKRAYPYGPIARRTIGFVRYGAETYNNHIGIEGRFDSMLAISPGYEVVKTKWRKFPFRLARLTTKTLERKEAVPGKDVQTTLDINLQMMADSILRKSIESNEVISGACLILAEVKTGAIRTMVNLVRDGDEGFKEYYNVAIGYPYEPGTLLWPAVEIASTKCGASKFTVDAFAGDREQSFVDSLRQVILGGQWNREEWDIAGLRRLECASPSMSESWSRTLLSSLGRGYCIQAPALDYLSLYLAIARGGEGVRTHLVMSDSIEKYNLCTSEQAKSLTDGLKQSTARNIAFRNTKEDVAGETGTSFAIQPNGHYTTDDGRKSVQSTFVGFFPADAPEYCALCMAYSMPSYRPNTVFEVPSIVVSNLVNSIYEQ